MLEEYWTSRLRPLCSFRRTILASGFEMDSAASGSAAGTVGLPIAEFIEDVASFMKVRASHWLAATSAVIPGSLDLLRSSSYEAYAFARVNPWTSSSRN